MNTKSLYKILIVLFSIVNALNMVAQRPFERNYGVSEGLVFQEINSVFSIPDGSIWCSTSNNEWLSHFDGRNWTHVKISEILKVSESLAGLVTHDNNIIFLFTNYVGIYKERKWKVVKIPENSFYLQHKAWPIQCLNQKNELFELDINKGIFELKRKLDIPNHVDGKIHYRVPTDMSHHVIVFKHNETGNLHYIKYSIDGEFIDELKPFTKRAEFLFSASKFSHQIINEKGESKIYFVKGGQQILVSSKMPEGTQCNFLKSAYLYGIPSYENGYIFQEKKENHRHVFVIDSSGLIRVALSHIAKSAFQVFSQDKLGRWWYGTSSGIMVQDPAILVCHESQSPMISGLHSFGKDISGNIWMGGYHNNGWCYFDGKKLIKPEEKYLKIVSVMPGAYSDTTTGIIYYFNETTNSLSSIQNKRTGIVQVDSVSVGFFIQKLKNETWAFGMPDYTVLLMKQKNGKFYLEKKINKEKGLDILNILTIAEDKKGRLWMGRVSQGVSMYDPHIDKAKTWLRDTSEHTWGLLSTLVDKQGRLWMGSNQGLKLCEKPHEVNVEKDNIFKLSKHINLPGNDCTIVAALLEINKYLVVATLKGVHFISKESTYSDRPKTKSLWYGKQLPSSETEQNTIIEDKNGLIWVGTQDGAIRINPQLLADNRDALTINIREIWAGDTRIQYAQNKIVIPDKLRNIRIAWDIFGTTTSDFEIFYDGQIINSKGDTIYAFQQALEEEISLPYLAPDHYTFIIRAYKENMEVDEKTISFSIPKLWTESFVFWLLIMTLALSIPIGIWFFQNNKKRILAEKELALHNSLILIDKHKLEAMSNFFNPHFINNALHWIQSRYRKDPDTVTVIGRLADNIHMIYNDTAKGQIVHSIQDEMLLVKNYLTIAKVRFGEKLNYFLPDSKSLEELGAYLIPNLMLQIYTENAVEKGIANNSIHGNIIISMEVLPDELIIIIEDDGIGRDLKSPENGTQRRSSTIVMEEMIQIYNQHNQHKLMVVYEDHWKAPDNNHHFNHGTRVKIILPKNYNYDISES